MKRTRLGPKNYETALQRIKDRRNGKKPISRYGLRQQPVGRRGKGIKARVASKAKTVDGAGARQVRDECDELVRRIIRLRDIYCFVCGVPRAHSELFPGHYITRKVLALRWSTVNVHAQCNVCNYDHNERPQWYRSMLVLEYDKATVERLDRIARENPHLEYSDLLEIRDGLRRELVTYELGRKEASL